MNPSFEFRNDENIVQYFDKGFLYVLCMDLKIKKLFTLFLCL